ncbi:hypothetical protein QYE76_023150 [Lolium multiflorum]|uniref:Uncharacterized protein n=1 Tax=Lolium multiflorum TaxID=4521 RepID=A0AAD8R9N7_LOLMU|nr:hypothetical protein QYE76_023150 [Lolium multiflorum]
MLSAWFLRYPFRHHSGLRWIDIALASYRPGLTSARSIHLLLLYFLFAESIDMPALMSKRPCAALREIHRELDRRRKLAAVAKGQIVKKSSPPPPIPNAATGAAIQKKSPAPIPRKPAAAAAMKPLQSIPLRDFAQRCTAQKRRDPMPFAMKISGVASGGIQKSPAPILRKPAATAIVKTLLPMPHKPVEAATKKSSAPTIAANKNSSTTSSRTTPPLVTPSAHFEPIQEGTTVSVRTPMGTTPTGLRLFNCLSAVVVSDAEDGYFEVMYNGDFPLDDPFRTVRVPRDQVKKMLSSSSRQ